MWYVNGQMGFQSVMCVICAHKSLGTQRVKQEQETVVGHGWVHGLEDRASLPKHTAAENAFDFRYLDMRLLLSNSDHSACPIYSP